MQAEHQVLNGYEYSLAGKIVGYSFCMSSKDSPCPAEKLSFPVELEDRVSSGKSYFSGLCSRKTVLPSKVFVTVVCASRVPAFKSLFLYYQSFSSVQ